MKATLRHLSYKSARLTITGAPGEPGTDVLVVEVVKDETLRSMFEGVGFPDEKLSFTDAEIDEFGKQYYGQLLEEDHATLFLRETAPGVYDVVGLERVGGKVDKNVFDLEHAWVWMANDGHQYVIPISAVELVSESAA